MKKNVLLLDKHTGLPLRISVKEYTCNFGIPKNVCYFAFLFINDGELLERNIEYWHTNFLKNIRRNDCIFKKYITFVPSFEKNEDNE